MGQYRSIKSTNLANQLANLEKELIALKSPQIYGTGQVSAYTSNIVTFDASIIYYRFDESQYGGSGQVISFGSNPTRLRFIGDKPGETIVGQLKMEVVGTGGAEIHCTYLKALRTDQPHILDWWIFISGSDYSLSGSPPDPNRTARCWVTTNDTGVLSIAETHNIHNHYQWITGTYYE